MTAVTPPPAAEKFLETRLRRWTPTEFRRMVVSGVFASNTPVELVNGEVYEYGLPRLWTRDEYYRLGDKEVFGPDERTELLDGRIIRKVTMNPPHVMGVFRTVEILRRIIGPDLFVFSQAPINLSMRNDPEPDAMIVSGDLVELSVRPPLPSETLLVVEVSDSTLREDRRYKAGLYAHGGIADYWIVNINARTLEVRRHPENDEYVSLEVYAEDESVAPLAAPNSPVRVANLLPFAQPDYPAEA